MSKEIKGTAPKAVETVAPATEVKETVETQTDELTSELLETLKAQKVENEKDLLQKRNDAKAAYIAQPDSDDLFDAASKANINFKNGDVATQKLIEAEVARLNNEKRNAEITALRNKKAEKFYIDIEKFIELSKAADESQSKLTEYRKNGEKFNDEENDVEKIDGYAEYEKEIGMLVIAANEANNAYKAHCEKILNDYVYGSVKPIAPPREKKDVIPSTAKSGSISADIILSYENARKGGVNHRDAKSSCKSVTSNTGQIWNVINAHYESAKGANDGNAIAEATAF